MIVKESHPEKINAVEGQKVEFKIVWRAESGFQANAPSGALPR